MTLRRDGATGGEESRAFLEAVQGASSWPLTLEQDLALIEALEALEGASATHRLVL